MLLDAVQTPRRAAFAAVLLFCLPGFGQTPDVELCSAPGLSFGGEAGGPSSIEDVIDVPPDLTVADVHVLVEISHTFIGDLFVDVSHGPVTVGLHGGGGAGADRLEATFDDAGAPSGSEPYDCACRLQPSGPGLLDEAILGDGAGEWTLAIQDVFPSSDDGVLERWCLQLYESAPPPPPPPVGNLICGSPPGSGTIQAAWSNSVAYEFFEIFVDGQLVATLPGFFFTYSSPPQSVPSIAQLSVVAYQAGVPSPVRTCEVALMPVIDFEDCVTSGAPIASELLPVISPLVVTEDISIGDIQVTVSITHTFIGDLGVSITSPAATTVVLHDQNGGADENLRVTYWEFGVANGDEPYDCECFVEPSGPGTLLDLLEESTNGTWNLLVQDFFVGDFGTLDQWCLQVFDDMPVFPVEDLSCVSGAEPGTAELGWTNALDYDEIDVFVDGFLEVTLPGPFGAGQPAAYTTLPRPEPGTVTICVVPRVGGVTGSQRCCTLPLVLAPVNDLILTSVGGSGEAVATWSNPLVYDSIEVTVGDDPAMVLPGDATTFVAALSVLRVGVTVCVRGIRDDFGVSPVACASVMVLPAAPIEGCGQPEAPVSSTLPPTVDVITLTETLLVIELEVSLSISHTFTGDLLVELQSPAGTQVRLHDQGGSASNDILALFTDDGAPNGSVPFACGCELQPSGIGGVGSLSDLTPQPAAGDWVLTVADIIAADDGTFHSWCIQAPEACELMPPSALGCAPGPDASVALDWTNGDTYDSVAVERDGGIIAILAGDASDYVDEGLSAGSYSYRVIGERRDLSCSAPSAPCVAAFGVTDVIFRGEHPAGVDSVAALSAALDAQGQVVLVVDALDLESLTPVESTVEVYWIQLGTFPDNHSLTFDEGLLLAELHTGDFGLDGQPDADPVPVHLEGGDVWGFDPPTPFADYDGIENGTALDGDDSLFYLSGQDSGFGLDLGGGAWDAFYVQDQAGSDFTDRVSPANLAPDVGGPAVGALWSGDDGTEAYDVGVYYNSTFAPVISQSFEIGGYGGDLAGLVAAYRLALLDAPPGETGDDFRRGDVVVDGSVQLNDVIVTLQFLFASGPEPECADAADTDDDGVVGLVDGIVLLNYLFTSGPPPAAPGPDSCGADPTIDALPSCSYAEGLCP